MGNTKYISFLNFWPNFNSEDNFIVNPLRKHYHVEVVAPEKADYVFFSVHGKEHLFVDDSRIKIFYTLENLCPDFNLCDYAIGFEYMNFGDRYFRLPGYMPYDYQKDVLGAETKHLLPPGFSLKNDKPKFCSYTISNGNRASDLLVELIETMDQYKQVDSGGKWRNNIGGPVQDKYAFDSGHKFSIVFENSSHPGYTTEKIIQAFAARTVPIYWGDPTILQNFNPKSFINVQDYKTVAEVVEKIKEIDSDDELFLRYLKQPIYKEGQKTSFDYRTDFESFLVNILSQAIESAKRRNRIFWGKQTLMELKKAEYLKTKKGLTKAFLSMILGEKVLGMLRKLK